MNISYNYEIKRVDEEFKVMDVEYTSVGLSSVTVSARLPFTGESVADVVDAFAPFGIWAMESATYDVPAVGVTGSKVSATVDTKTEEILTLESAKDAKVKEIAEWRKSAIETPFRSGDYLVAADQKTLNTLNSIKANLSSGVYSSVNFRFEDGEFASLSLTNIDAIIADVSLLMQSIFDDEKLKIEFINSLSSIEEVSAYNPALLPSVVI
jgi:hypothetical protein